MEKFHLHLISDATGETVQAVGRACLAQFEGATPTEHIWTLVRNEDGCESDSHIHYTHILSIQILHLPHIFLFQMF